MFTWIEADWRTIATWVWQNVCWIAVGVMILFMLSYWGCSSSPSSTTPSPSTGWLFLKLAFAGLVLAAYASREKAYLALTFTGMAVLIFLVLLGKFDGLFVWAILGLPLFAAAGIWGYTKTTGRTQSFLGFASGVLIIFWMFLLYLGHTDKIRIGFLGTLFPDDISKVIFTLALAIFLFATWKRSRVFYLISFVVFLSFLGNATVNQIFDRFPEKLTPKVSEKTKNTWEKMWQSLLDAADKATSPAPAVPPVTETPAAPPPSASAPKRELQSSKETARLVQNQSAGISLATKSPQGNTHFSLKNGGKALLVVDLPFTLKFEGNACFAAFITRYYPGNMNLSINGRHFDYDHRGGGQMPAILCFPASCLRPGTNSIVLSSSGEDIFVEKVEIRFEYTG